MSDEGVHHLFDLNDTSVDGSIELLPSPQLCFRYEDKLPGAAKAVNVVAHGALCRLSGCEVKELATILLNVRACARDKHTHSFTANRIHFKEKPKPLMELVC